MKTEDRFNLYKKYLENCTDAQGSVDKYSNFSRIDGWVRSKYPDFKGFKEVDNSKLALDLCAELNSWDSMPDKNKPNESFKKLGNGQYYNAVISYIKFLKCLELFGDIKEDTINKYDEKSELKFDLPLQQIFYGAPGTGKSFTVDGVCKSFVHYRTTFHPDSDYSTFVGCYKPQNVSGERIYDKMELKNKLNIIKNSGVSYPCQKFATKYWQSLKLLLPGDIKEILTECEFTDSMSSEILKGIGIGEELMPDQYNSRIVYQFSPQVFTRAYVEAWKKQEKGEKVYLVIEEINRGNCAQIFGDLFQLLDRDENGFSKYEIVPDTDLMQYLKSQSLNAKDVLDSDGNDISLAINSGELMKLPNNLYIWATMNTSDQSLFPIDSAFKRRWDWQYMPIGKGYDENGQEIKWVIEGQTKKYDWWSFLEMINAEVAEVTQSEDKKLGFFFCKATDGVISAEKFVGKVIFYLWNDVFKDNGFDSTIFKDSDGSELSFSKFYKSDMKGNAIVQKDKVELFLNNLKVYPISEIIQGEDLDNGDSSADKIGKDNTKYTINGEGSYNKTNLSTNAIKKYIELNPKMSPTEVVEEWMSLGNIVSHFVETKEQFDARTDTSKRSNEIECGDSKIYAAHHGWIPDTVKVLVERVNAKDWGIRLSVIETI